MTPPDRARDAAAPSTPEPLEPPAASSGRSAALAAAVVAATARPADGGSAPEDATLQQVVQAAVDQLEAGYGALVVLAPGGGRLDRFVVAGTDGGAEGPTGRRPEGGLLGALLEAPVTVSLDDVTQQAAALGFPADSPALTSFLGVPVCVGQELLGSLYLTEKRGGAPFTEADAEAARALAAVAGLAIANGRHAQRAERQRTWLQAAVDISTALLADIDPAAVLHAVVRHVTALTDAELGALLLPTPDDGGRTLTIAAAVGGRAADFEGVRVPVAGTTTGGVHRTGRGATGENPILDSSPAPVATEIGALFGPWLIVPLNPAEPAGVLFAARSRGRDGFDPELVDLLSGFATQVQVALRLARSQERTRRLQVQADRARIARDLHDHVVQRIFATALSLDRLGRSIEDRLPEAAARLSRSVDELDQTIADIRAAIFELQKDDDSPPTTLGRQVADLVRQVTEGHPLRRDVRVRGRVDELPSALVPDLLAVVRELVTNVVRHAGASRVTVTLTAEEEIRVVVTDDGRGLHPAAARSGLANLADRAERRGGRLTLQPRATGTQVRWCVPRS